MALLRRGRAAGLLLGGCFMMASPSMASEVICDGQVADEWTQPLAGVTVRLVGTQVSATTDAAGRFNIKGDMATAAKSSVPGSVCLFEFSARGYEPQTFAADFLQVTGVSVVLLREVEPKEGEPVDMARWAHVYRKESMANPSETQLLGTWPMLKPPADILCGCLWEEPRRINRVKVEFRGADEAAPALAEIDVGVKNTKGSIWSDAPTTWYAGKAESVSAPQGGTRFGFDLNVEGIQKLYIRYKGTKGNVGVPLVRVFGSAQWRKPLTVDVEWGFDNNAASGDACTGWAEAYNGMIAGISPLDDGNGLTMMGARHFREGATRSGRRGVKMLLHPAQGPIENRSNITLWTSRGNFSFAVRDLDKGPILVPSLGFFVAKSGGGVSARQFVEQVARSGKKTIRQRVRELPEQTMDNAMKVLLGKSVFPDYPKPPYEPVMKIDVPEKAYNEQWKLGAWHLKRWSQKVESQWGVVSASSSVENPGWSKANLLMGSATAGCLGYSSEAHGSASASEWVEVDMASDTAFDRIVLHPRGGGSANFPVDFKIIARKADGTVLPLVAKTGYPKPVQDAPQAFEFPAVSARYVRIEASKLGAPSPDEAGKYRLQLARLNVLKGTAPAKVSENIYCVSIWPFDKSDGGAEGTAAIGGESFENIRALDYMGLSDIAEGGLNYWIYGDHVNPLGWYADVTPAGAFVNAFNSPNHRSPGYDQANAGHAPIMSTIVLHYSLTRDKDWLEKTRPALKRACEWTVAQRDAWKGRWARSSPSYGHNPPPKGGDWFGVRGYFGTDAFALKEMTSLLAQSDDSMKGMVGAAELAVDDFRRSIDRSVALTPVVGVRDGTYRRWMSWQPYLRGLGVEMPLGISHPWYLEGSCSGVGLIGAYDPRDSICQDFLDVYEDILGARKVGEPPSGDWISRSGFESQIGHEPQAGAHLLVDDAPLYIRTVCNGYAADIEPGTGDDGYVFWEHARGGTATTVLKDKTFEEAVFINRVRLMLVMEENESLWLARATPRAWLEQGKKISVQNAPTFFGTLAYRIISDVDNGRITATVEIPSRNAPRTILLRLRHPKAVPLKGVEVNGKPWSNFDKDKEIVRIEGLSGTVTVRASY